jgi:hypothetical protein
MYNLVGEYFRRNQSTSTKESTTPSNSAIGFQSISRSSLSTEPGIHHLSLDAAVDVAARRLGVAVPHSITI